MTWKPHEPQLAPLVFPHAEVFIETGFGGGLAIHDVLNYRPGYQDVHSIDIDPPCRPFSYAEFQPDSRFHFHLGSSPDVLPRIIDRTRSTVFWLDAHYSPNDGQVVPPKEGQCPLLAELNVIFSAPWQAPLDIFIDDVPLFTLPSYEGTIYAGCDRAQFPTRHDIFRCLPPRTALIPEEYAGTTRYYRIEFEGNPPVHRSL